MIKLNENVQHLKELEEATYYHIRTFNKYATDHSIEEDDYSSELLFQQALFHLQCFKRATTNFKGAEINKINKDLESFLNNTISEQTKTFSDRYSEFETNYYSRNRIEVLFQLIKNSIVAGSEKNDLEEDIILLLEIKDSYDLRTNESYQYDWLLNINSRIFDLKNEIQDIYKKNYFMFNYFAELKDTYSKANLIPPSEEYVWWYSYKPITITDLKKDYYKMILQEIGKKNLINELSKKLTGNLKKLKGNLDNVVDWIGENSKDVFDEIIGAYTPSKKQLSFATYNEEEKTAVQKGDLEPHLEDFAFHPGHMISNPIINKEIIENLISLVQDAENIDEIKRREILATAYLMIGKNETAVSLLDHED